MNSRRGRLAGAFAAACVVATVAVSAVGVSPAGAVWAAPRYVRSIGGDGIPGLYAWGIQYNPQSNQIFVGDYLNMQLRRYDLQGNPLGSSYRTPSQGQPYSLAIDPNDGDVYVPEIRDGGQRSWIAKYDKFGNYMWSFRITSLSHYHAWMATDSQGRLYIMDSHYTASSGSPNRIVRVTVNDSNQTFSTTTVKSSYGTGAGQIGRSYGIDVDSAGNIWVTDSINSVLHKYSSSGAWIGDYGQGLFTDDVRSVVIDDAHGVLYVADASASKIYKFDTAGNLLGSWGQEGPAPGDFGGGPRQLTVTPDGNVWAADYGNFRVNVYQPDGTFLFDTPRPPRGAAFGHLSQPRDVDVDSVTGDVWVADGWNQRVQRFDSDGSHLGHWGHRSGAPPYGFNYPRGIGIDPATGNVWVVNERGHYIRVFDPTMESILFEVGSPIQDNNNTGNLRWPMDVEFWNGKAITGDRVSGLIKVFNSSTGAELSRITRANHGIAVNPANGDIYAVDPATDRVYQYTSTGTAIRNWGSSGTGNGQFQFAWDAVFHNDTLYVADSDQSRIQAFSSTGTFLGKWGSYNTGPYDFKNASGLAVDEATGYLYVADAGNNRIQVYDLSTTRAPYEFPKPTVSITTPTPGAIVADSGQYLLTGTATDNVSVATISIAVQDTATGQWWRSADASWQTTKTYGLAAWTGASPTSVAWEFPMNGLSPGGTYLVEAKAVDHWNNVNAAPNPTRSFSVLAELNDTADPDTSVTAPTPDQEYLANLPIAFSGDATDDVGVAEVRLAVSHDATWLQPDGTFDPAFAWLPTTLGSTGAPSTSWSYTAPTLAAGDYGMTVQAVDLAGKLDLDRPFVDFIVLPADTTPPTGALVSPAPGGSVQNPGGPLPITGTVSDAHSVVSVDVAIKDTVANQWLQPGGTWGSFTYVPAVLADPGAPSTGWSYSFAQVQERTYGFQARAADLSGNSSVFRPYTTFTVTPSGPVDTTPPTGALVFPTTNANVPFGPITATGTAADDVSVAAVEVAIKNVPTNQWLQPNGTWGAAFVWVQATLDAPGTPSTDWTLNFTPPNLGKFGIQARARDGVGRVATIRTYTTFNVV